jgi:alcohol oxidase
MSESVLTAASFPGDPSSVPAGQYFAVSAFTVYPYSRGHLHITGPELSDGLDFETGFFSDAGGIDIKKHMWAYKKQREIVRRMETYRGEVAGGHPPFPAGSKAANIETDGPLTDVQDIEYTAEDDAVLEQWLRENVGTTWHSVGTCKMAPPEKMGVVDAKLSVYGVEGLKVADLSILPRNVAANTNNTALAIGEKAADIFIEEMGLGKK